MKNTYLLKIINEDRQILIEKMFHKLEDALNEINIELSKINIYDKESLASVKILSDIQLKKRLNSGEKIY